MAGLFDDASSERYTKADTIPAFPCAMAAWFRTDAPTLNAGQGILFTGDTGGVEDWIRLTLQSNASGDPLRAQVSIGSGETNTADSTTGVTDSNWHHGVASFDSNAGATVFLDGGNSATDTTEPLVWTAAIDSQAIGAWYHGPSAGYIQPFSGDIAEPAFWSSELDAVDAAVLAAGFSPKLVRPDSLVSYTSMVRNLIDEVDGSAWTANGTPGVANHPRIIQRRSHRSIFVPTIAAGGTIPHKLVGPGGLIGPGGLAGQHGGLVG